MMFKRIMELFSLSPEEAEQVDATEAASRGKAMLRKANRTLTSAEQQVAKAKQQLFNARLECQNRYRDYLHARQQRPAARKAAGALEYIAKLRLAAGQWEMAERMCDRGHERLVAAREAKKEATARQKKASALVREAEAILRKGSKK